MNYFEIGQRIKNKRKENSLTQERLAEMVDISLTHMSHIETGTTKLSLPVLVRIANALKCTTDELLFDSLVDSKNIIRNDIDNILNQCSKQQALILLDVVKATKTALDKYK